MFYAIEEVVFVGVSDDIDVHIVLQELEFNVTIGIQAFGWHAGQMAQEGGHKGIGPCLEFDNQLVSNSIGIHHVGCRSGWKWIQSRHQFGGGELSSLWKHPCGCHCIVLHPSFL